MSFPASPTNGQTTIINGITYSYNSTTNAWAKVLLTSNGNVSVSSLTVAGQITGYHTGAIGANTANSGVFTSVTTTSGGQLSGYLTGPVGANTANSGVFTTLTATSGYQGAASGPLNGTLGATTPNTVVATSVTTTSGGQLTGYLTGAIGANTANSGAFTTVTATGNQSFTTAAYLFSYAGGTSGQVRSGFQLDGTNQQTLFFTATNERMRIDSSGQVGIGTTSPSEALTVSRSTGEAVIGIRNTGTASSWLTLAPGSAGSAYIHNTGNTSTIFTTNGTERMRIDSSGNVGIGTSSPSTYGKLAVIASSGNQISFGDSYASSSSNGYINYGGNSGALILNAYSTGGSTYQAFYTSNGGTNTERMRIDSSGNVGIGNSSPNSKLTVAGTIESTTGGVKFPDATIQTTAASAGGQIQAVIFTSSTTWTAPTGVTKVFVTCVGGGGGASYGTDACGNWVNGVGGGGGIVVSSITVVPGTVYTITVGTGGAGKATGGTAGSGSTSSFGSLVTSTGGGGGTFTYTAPSTYTATAGAQGSGSTTGTVLRSGYITNSYISSYLNGQVYNLSGAAQAGQTWSTSSLYAAGAYGYLAGGGFSGAILIQYVG